MAAVPEEEVRARVRGLRARMRRHRLGAVLLTSGPAIHYYTAFSGISIDQNESALVVTARQAALVTNFCYLEEAQRSAQGCEVLLRERTPVRTAAQVLRRMQVRRVGFQETALSVRDYEDLQHIARGCRFLPWAAHAAGRRLSKSPWEVRRIRRAVRVAERAFLDLRDRITEGMTEAQVARELVYLLGKHGADAPAFPIIAACGATASLPHVQPGRRRLRQGGLLLVDWGARVDHYHSDLTRVLFLGAPSRTWRERYGRVLEAHDAALRTVLAGGPVTGAEADRTARDVLGRADLAERFGHSLGHGLGLEVHEAPQVSARNEDLLPPGAVVTIEPGVYFPRSGGIRIEDIVLVGEQRGRRLGSLPTDFDWACL